MKYSIILLLIISVFQVAAQGTSKFEVWGWEGTMEQFIEVYRDSTGTDLNYGYTCAADLKKMGYKYSESILFLNDQTDIKKFRNGTLNWDSTERVAIIRQISHAKYTRSCAEESNLIKESVFSLAEMDSIRICEQLNSGINLKSQVLIGSLSENVGIRRKSTELVKKHISCFIPLQNNELEILAEMLSFPDPSTASVALVLINESDLGYEENSILFSRDALTVIDFLNSKLKTFRSDAIQFLTKRFPNQGEKSKQEWQELISSIN